MKRLNIVSYALIIMATLLYAALTWRELEGDWSGMGHFFGMLLVRGAIIGAIACLLWLFKKRVQPALFCFSLLYFLSLMQASWATALELGKKSQLAKELQAITPNGGADQTLFIQQLKGKNYSQEKYGEYVSALIFIQKFSLYHHEELQERQKIAEGLDYDGMLSAVSLGDKEKMLAARKRLQEAYFAINALQKRSINYYSNLIRIFENKQYANWVVKEKFDEMYANVSDSQIDCCYALYDTMRNQLYAYDDLLVFVINRQGFYSFKNGHIAFDSELDKARYSAFVKKIEDLEQKEINIQEEYSAIL